MTDCPQCRAMTHSAGGRQGKRYTYYKASPDHWQCEWCTCLIGPAHRMTERYWHTGIRKRAPVGREVGEGIELVIEMHTGFACAECAGLATTDPDLLPIGVQAYRTDVECGRMVTMTRRGRLE